MLAEQRLCLPEPLQGEQNMGVQPLPLQTEHETSPCPPQFLHFVDPLHTEQYIIAPTEAHRHSIDKMCFGYRSQKTTEILRKYGAIQ